MLLSVIHCVLSFSFLLVHTKLTYSSKIILNIHYLETEINRTAEDAHGTIFIIGISSSPYNVSNLAQAMNEQPWYGAYNITIRYECFSFRINFFTC